MARLFTFSFSWLTLARRKGMIKQHIGASETYRGDQ
jgi:hypothetical protein